MMVCGVVLGMVYLEKLFIVKNFEVVFCLGRVLIVGIVLIFFECIVKMLL